MGGAGEGREGGIGRKVDCGKLGRAARGLKERVIVA